MNRWSELCPRSRDRKRIKDAAWYAANPDKRFRKHLHDRIRYATRVLAQLEAEAAAW
jgi:hypothetical protein